MRNRRFLLSLAGIAILATILVSGPNKGFAQLAVNTATLTGTVTDSSGSLLPSATVILTSPEKGITRTFATDASGHYSFGQLPPATYSLVIEMKGFKRYRQDGILLEAGRSANQDVELSVGAQTEQVTVTSQAPLLNTDNANIATDIAAKQIVDLPLNLRNVFGLLTLNSSVNNATGTQTMLGGSVGITAVADQDISFLNFGGGFFGTTAFMVDGVWDTSADWGANVYVPSPDDVQEMKVQNFSFTAQYGWSTGNVVNVVTKSGTNTFHGSAYEFYRNSSLDANLWFGDHDGLPKEAFNRNQSGVAVGGPLYIPGLYRQREKTFIFGLYEHLSVGTPEIGTYTVPDSNFRAGNFSQLLGAQVGTDALGRPILSGQIYNPRSARAITAGTVDPTTGLVATQTGHIRDPIPNNNVAALGPFDALGAKFVGYYPNPSNSSLTNNFTGTATAPASSNEYSLRVDQNISDASRFYVRYSYKQETEVQTPEYWGSANVAGPGNNRPDNRYQLVAGYGHVFSPTLTLNLTSGFEHWGETSTNQSYGFKPSTLGLPSYLDTNSPEFPIVNMGTESPLGPVGGAENDALRPTGSGSADLVKIVGRHTMSFGLMVVDSQVNTRGITQTTLDFNGTFTNGPDPDNPTANTGNGIAQALLGVLDGGSTGIAFNPAISKYYQGWYLQDDWRVVPKLTLNLGIRYEIQFAPTYRHNSAAYFNPDIPNPIGTAIGEELPGALVYLSANHRASYNTNYGNVAPRLGFSYQAVPKLVVHGGYGFFYPPSLYPNSASLDGFSSTTSVVESLDKINPNPAVSTNNPWPYGFVPITGNSLGALQDVGFNPNSNYNNRLSSYVQQYTLGFQYAFRSNDVLDVGYVGNHGSHLAFCCNNASQLNPSYLSLGADALDSLVPNPFYGKITSSACGLDQPTVVQSQLLQPFPQYCSVTVELPTAAYAGEKPAGRGGWSSYNALQVSYNHRFSEGLTALISYTYSKFLDNTDGTGTWGYVGNQGPANNYDLAAEKSVDGSDTPHSLVASYVYELPIGRGKAIGSNFNRATNTVLGGWQVSGISTFKQGFPLSISGYNINSYGGQPRPDLIGNVHVRNRGVAEWFNTGAFTYAAYGTFGTSPRFLSNLRAPGYQNWDFTLMKNLQIRESIRFQLRAEAFDVFNHPNFYAPNTSYAGCDPNAVSGCNSAFGQITATLPSRQVQIAGKFYW